MQKPKVGAHVSTSGGILKALKRAQDMGAECMQIFAGTPRRYDVSFPGKEEREIYKKEVKKMGAFPVYVHANYLINLASQEKRIQKISEKSLKETLLFSSLIEAQGVVYHPGSAKGGDKKEAMEREIKSILGVLKDTPEKSFLLIENTAGSKKIGDSPQEIGYIFKKIKSARVKVCVDLAHSLEAGNIKEYSKKEVKAWISQWEKEVGLENIFLLHANDSLTTYNSQHDRHANIGKGEIGEKGFKELMSFSELENIPWILEVPGFEGKGPDKENIDILKRIRGEIT